VTYRVGNATKVKMINAEDEAQARAAFTDSAEVGSGIISIESTKVYGA